MDLSNHRNEIDRLDALILQHLSERATHAAAIGKIKHAAGEPVYRPEREAQIYEKLANNNPGELKNEGLRAIWREIMSACRALEAPESVAYLGPLGTYSEQAAQLQFGAGALLSPCATIDEVFRRVESGAVTYGVVPLENSTEGAVNRSLDLLLGTSATVIAERSLPIHHALLTQSGSLSGITEVHGHTQSLAQCHNWLANNAPQLAKIPAASNGAAAKLAAESSHIAAIASESAGEQYGLKVVAQKIQDLAHNRTRFAVLGLQSCAPAGGGLDHTSLILSVPNAPGAVVEMLKPLAANGVSMTRFESRPAHTGKWEYYFYIDIEGHAQTPNVAAALAELQQKTAFYKCLGSYPVFA